MQPHEAAGKIIHSILADEKVLTGKGINLCAIKKDISEYANRRPAKTKKQSHKPSSKARTAIEVHRHHLRQEQVGQLVKHLFGKGLKFRL